MDGVIEIVFSVFSITVKMDGVIKIVFSVFPIAVKIDVIKRRYKNFYYNDIFL